jgi:16S rRNA (guanine1207-N2)-methyltransferase
MARRRMIQGVMADLAPDLAIPGPALLVDCAPEVRGAIGAQTAGWRRLGPGARAWAPEGTFAAAVVRLPRGKQALEMVLHAVAARLPAGAPLWLFGANDEGARSSGGRLAPLFEAPETVDTRRRCRVLRATRGDAPARGAIDDWATPVEIPLPGGPETLLSWPGLFAHGRLDPASAMLIDALPALDLQGAVLDFGCGAGALSAGARRLAPGCALTLLDADPLAVHAARLNLPCAAVYRGDGWGDLPPGRFDRVISNPPFHAGRAEDFSVFEGLVRGAPERLGPGGALALVTQRTAGVGPLLRGVFRHVEVLSEDSHFQVWRGR